MVGLSALFAISSSYVCFLAIYFDLHLSYILKYYVIKFKMSLMPFGGFNSEKKSFYVSVVLHYYSFFAVEC